MEVRGIIIQRVCARFSADTEIWKPRRQAHFDAAITRRYNCVAVIVNCVRLRWQYGFFSIMRYASLTLPEIALGDILTNHTLGIEKKAIDGNRIPHNFYIGFTIEANPHGEIGDRDVVFHICSTAGGQL